MLCLYFILKRQCWKMMKIGGCLQCSLVLHILSLFHTACFFGIVLSSLLFDILISFHILDSLTAFGIVWMWTQFGLLTWFRPFSLVLDFVVCLVNLKLCSRFDNNWICAFQLCAFMFSKHYPSLSMNQEKSRDLQRGLTDSSQLPLMMSPN